jgi:2-dehydropantoate 2-reductase
MTRTPRIAIFGAGSIGCHLGTRLALHAPVTLIGRPRLGEAIARHGLHATAFDGTDVRIDSDGVGFSVSPDAARDAGLVLVTVKSAATAEAARALAEVLAPGSLVVSFQNGLRNAAVLERGLPHCRVLAGMTPFNVVQFEPGHTHQATSGDLMAQADAALASFLPAFAAAGLPLRQRTDMPQVMAGKLLLNLNNALNALSGVPLKQELETRAWRRCLALAQAEALKVYAAAGIKPARVTPLPSAWLPTLMRLPDGLFRTLAARMLRIDPAARSSMWEDLEAGRATEVDVLQGEIVDIARSCGMAAPVSAKLVELVHQAERERRSWRAEELLDVLMAAA